MKLKVNPKMPIRLRQKAKVQANLKFRLVQSPIAGVLSPVLSGALGVFCALALWQPAAQADDLASALAAVYQKNPRLLAERARLSEADENYIQARAQGRLSATASGTVGWAYSRTPPINIPGGLSGSALGISSGEERGTPRQGQVEIVQPLYQGGRVQASKHQAKLGILAAREALRAQENRLFLATAEAYVDVLRDEEAAKVRRNSVRVLVRQMAASQERFDVGVGTRTDIAQSQSRLALSEAGLAQAEAALASSRATYKRLIGRLPVDLQTAPNFALPLDLEAVIALARENNPQLRAAYFNEAAGGAAVDVAKSAGQPVVSLVGNMSGARDQILGSEEAERASVVAQVRVPIFSGGGNRSRLRQARHAKRRLGFESRETERAVDEAVTQIWAQLDAARHVSEAASVQLSAAKIAFEGVELEQSVGTRTQLEVLDAEQEVLDASLALLNAKHDVEALSFQLLSTIGVFDMDGIAQPLNLQAANLDNVEAAGEPTNNTTRLSADKLQESLDKYAPAISQKPVSDLTTRP